MLKVFLVEDESIIRESIKKNIRWEEHGFLFCGEAGDGELAYSLISEKKPDIVITDIKMPFMDGLELAQLMHQVMPLVKIIFLAGYGEFEYAQKAIQIGAAEYILKPVSGAELTEALDRVAKVILEERQQRAFIQQYQQEMEEKEKQNQLGLFEDIVGGGRTALELLHLGARLGLSLSAGCYATVLFSLQRQPDQDEPIPKS